MGANDFISKPFDRMELVSKIKNYITIKPGIAEAPVKTLIKHGLSGEQTCKLIDEINAFYASANQGEYEIQNLNDDNFDSVGHLFFTRNDQQFIYFFGAHYLSENFIFQKLLITIWLIKLYHDTQSTISNSVNFIKTKILGSEHFNQNNPEWWLIRVRLSINNKIGLAGFNKHAVIINSGEIQSVALAEKEELEILSKNIGLTVHKEKLILFSQEFRENLSPCVSDEFTSVDSSNNMNDLKAISEKLNATNAFIIRIET